MITEETSHPQGHQLFRLYIAGDAPNSLLARANLVVLCRWHLPAQHTIEIIDVLQEPNRVLADGIVATPTLIRIFPRPALRIVGALTREKDICVALGFDFEARPNP
jgi:circadian clock protein KaiB